MKQSIQRWKAWANRLKIEIYALYLAYGDPRTPWHAKVVAACVVGYAFSPIDLIPDFIPLVGYLDDLLLLPLGVALALRLVPREVLSESRERAGELVGQSQPVNRLAGVVILLVWAALAGLAMWWGMKVFKR
jgi:uncharacterized membrane protein YkvA (DUF1232 family)